MLTSLHPNFWKVIPMYLYSWDQLHYLHRNGHLSKEECQLFILSARRRRWHPTPVLLPGKNPMDRGAAPLSMGSLRVGHNWATSLSLFTFMHWRRKWHPTPVFLPGESQGRGSLVAAVCGVTQSRTRLKWLSSSILRATKAFRALCIQSTI